MARALRHKETIMFSQGLQHFTAEAVVPEQLLHYVTAVAGSRPLACAGFTA